MEEHYYIHGATYMVSKMKEKIIQHTIVGLSCMLFCIAFYIGHCLPDWVVYLMAWLSLILFTWMTYIYKIYLYTLFAAIIVFIMPAYTGTHVFWKYTDPLNIKHSERFNTDNTSGTIVFFKDESVVLFLDNGQCISKYRIAEFYCKYYKKKLNIK